MEIRGQGLDKERKRERRKKTKVEKRERKKKKKMRYDHYKRVVQWDRIQRFPYIKNQAHLPKLESMTRVWSLIGLGFQPNRIPAAWTGLDLMTGQKPVRLYTKK